MVKSVNAAHSGVGIPMWETDSINSLILLVMNISVSILNIVYKGNALMPVPHYKLWVYFRDYLYGGENTDN